MGLDTSHDCWSGPYSAFMRWRHNIAKVAGFPPIDIMEGFYKPEILPLSGIYKEDSLIREYLQRGELPLKWENQLGDTRLIPLLTHSDCDGEISPEDCKIILAGLEELLPKLSNENSKSDNPRADYDGTYNATVRFISGLKDAISKNEPVIFG
jgi:hypothetical protein